MIREKRVHLNSCIAPWTCKQRESEESMKRRDFTKAFSVQAVAASALPSALLASNDVHIEEIDIEKPMDQASDLVDLFYAHMKLCEIKE